MRIYISGAFIASRDWEAAIHRYEQLGLMLRAAGFDVYLPHTRTDPIHSAAISARDVYERDVKEVYTSDIMLALLDEPSHGVGAEIALAICSGMSVIGAGSCNQNISRFIKGMLEASKTGEYFEYEHLGELVEKAVEVMEFKRHQLCARASS